MTSNRHLRDIDLNLLVLFRDLMQTRSISATARRLDMSQPAASNALARLRLALGDELLVRAGQSMQPTRLAERIAGDVDEGITHLQAALQRRDAFDSARDARRFVLGMTDLGEVHFMPRYLCPACWSEDLEWFEAKGKGKVHSFSIIRRASSAAYAPRVPYVVELIDLDEGPRMMSNIVGADALDVVIGDAVTLEFEERGDAKLPQFARARG